MTTIRIAVTVTSFLIFIVICWWAWNGRQKAAFDAAARLPLNDEDPQGGVNDMPARQRCSDE